MTASLPAKFSARRRSPVRALTVSLFILCGLSLGVAADNAYAGEAIAAEAHAALRTGDAVAVPPKATTVKIGRETGLPLPRFVSLKFSETNLRVGPGTRYGRSWTYRRKGLPVEIVQEFDRWRRIRDSDGTTGWVLHSLLSARRTAIVAPWRRGFEAQVGGDVTGNSLAALALLNGKKDASDDARTVARFQPGLQVRVDACTGNWCAVEVNATRAWLKQDKLWGVYERENVGG